MKRAGCSSCSSPARGAASPADLEGRRRLLVKTGVDTGNWDYVVALAGNPNTGKSTVFNNLTGLRQHTGNWPGKTVTRAEGGFSFSGRRYKLVDLPGTYSLLSMSADEEIARNFILFARPDVTVAVVDATRLERSLNLVLQILEITDRAVVCLNLVDEAAAYGLNVDAGRLSEVLGVPAVSTAARHKRGMTALLEAIHDVASGQRASRPHRADGGSPELRRARDALVAWIEEAFPGVPNARWVALRLLEGDPRIVQAVRTGELERLAPLEVCVAAAPPRARNPAPPAAISRDRILEEAEKLRWDVGPNLNDSLTEALYQDASRIAGEVVERTAEVGRTWDRALDRLVTGRWTGFPVMFAMLAAVFWITVEGAHTPSRWLDGLLIGWLHPLLKSGAAGLGLPWWLDGLLIDGAYLATAWVVAVMLPPMAIFFPLFTLLEDFGYLPRVAYNLDRLFRISGAHGKQALTMSMGFGCNAAGIVATRIIDSPRERLIAIITNNFALCNGRWPTQILLASVFIGSLVPPAVAGFISAATVVGVALLGVFLTFLVSWVMSRSLLRGKASTFSLELPPYRRPRILWTLYTSLIDRTIFVLWRAILFAVPAGVCIWLTANISVAGVSIAEHLIDWLEPFGLLIGLNGIILLAYIVAIPANEIVIPTALMLTVMTAKLAGVGTGAGVIFESETDAELLSILAAGGWTLLTAVNLMLFSLLHNPCSTTLYTIYRETRSGWVVFLSAAIPLGIGLTTCFLVAQVWRLCAPT